MVPTGVVEMRYWLKNVALFGTPSVVINGWELPRSRDLVQRYQVPAGLVTISCSAPLFAARPQISFMLPPGQVVPVFYADSLVRRGGGWLSLTDPGPERRREVIRLAVGIPLGIFTSLLIVGGVILLLNRLLG